MLIVLSWYFDHYVDYRNEDICGTNPNMDSVLIYKLSLGKEE